MKILDTNGLDHMVKEKIKINTLFCVTPDVQDEFETWHEQKLPKNVENVFDANLIDKAIYLQSYREMLNAHGGRSFYNMSGFGDISILALLRTKQIASSGVLPGLLEDIEIVSNDKALTSKIRKAFCSGTDPFCKTVKVTKVEDFFRS